MTASPPPRYPYVHVHVPNDQVEQVSAEMWDWGATGIEERDSTTIDGPSSEDHTLLVVSYRDEALAHEVAEHFSDRNAQVNVLEGDAWRDAWKEYFEPSRVSTRVCLQPPWKNWPAEPGDVVLTIDPGRAFGTGLHESTRLVLREIDRTLQGGERILDVGCGSGILAIAALRLGARAAVCTDNDPEVVPIALENATANGVGEVMVASATPVGEIEGTFDQVYANIQAHVLIDMAESLAARTQPEGLLVLSGVLAIHEQEVLSVFSRWFEPIATTRENEWVALSLTRKQPPDA